MRVLRNFNEGWLFTPDQVDHHAPDDSFEAVTLPHTNKLFSQRFVNNLDYQFASTYRKHFGLPDDVSDKHIFIDFEGVMLTAAVFVNGELVGIHKGGYTPFSVDITQCVEPGDNLLTVYVDSTEDKSVPPYGNQVDYLTFGGIYRDVHLRMVDTYHIVEAFPCPTNVLTSPGLACDVRLSQWTPELHIEAILEDAHGMVIASKMERVTSAAFTVSFEALNGIELWSLENPALYNLALIVSVGGQTKDRNDYRLGFRSAEFRKDGRFYLNDEPLKLFGLNRHQTYPYIGAAAPARLQRMDADILKNELGCNIVRTSHYAQSPHFLNRCDEIGLLVLEELAGWQHIGDEAWQALVMQDLQAMIERDRHHPSIILWGVRVNESPDNDALYTRTNALAHELDPSRQTAGVRNFIKSHFLEDVFTLNDFTEGIQTPLVRPHLITEFGGHMFPTKTWDQEERRIEHALKHARKHNHQMGHPDVAGAIGWCAFDYHTHKDFGSGDRICHHGVMDMHRLPKMAAYFYRSQKSPADEIVLYPATNWTMGDRSGGGNNPLTVFSNCEQIEILIGDRSQGHFSPDCAQFPHLAHPPFTVRWPDPYNPWWTPFDDLTVRGFINGQVVAEHKIAADHIPQALCLSAHTQQLSADGADMTRIAVSVVDRYGNPLPYQALCIRFVLEGDADLIGENPMPLFGGQGACYVKSRHTAGPVIVSAHTDGLPPASITLHLT